MTNLLNNPFLSGFSLGRYFTEENGQVGTIENPTGWEFIAIPRESDPNKLAQSLHRDKGFVIAAGYRAWEAGYKQSVQVQAGQRYLAKAVFKPDVNFTDNNQDLTAVTWRFRIVSPSGTLEQSWQSTGKGQYKQDEENLFVFHAAQSQVIEFHFMVRSTFAGNVTDFNIYEFALEPVDNLYGGGTVPVLGAAPSSASSSATATASASSAASTSSPVAAASTSVSGPSGKSLGTVLSASEIDTIVLGLRELAKQVNPTAAAGLNTLASGFERLK